MAHPWLILLEAIALCAIGAVVHLVAERGEKRKRGL